jgi:hypothetical protein
MGQNQESVYLHDLCSLTHHTIFIYGFVEAIATLCFTLRQKLGVWQKSFSQRKFVKRW